MPEGAARRLLRNENVEVELGHGTYTVHWPATRVSLGPCHALMILDDGVHASTGDGAWDIAAGNAAGRAGTWARWRLEDGPSSIAVHVATAGATVVVESSFVVPADGVLDRVIALEGDLDLAYDHRLVDGYDSWAYSGIRGPEPGASFWNVAFVGEDGRGLAVQALGADRLCTRVTNDGMRIRVECGATPPLEKVRGTWGYLTGAPPPLGIRCDPGTVIHAETIALASTNDALASVEELAVLASGAMQARRWEGAPPIGWESWYQYGLFVSADDVVANARTLRERYAQRPGFDLVQIDDGWQRTYGAWWPNERFPDDLGDLVSTLHELGCRAGLWLAPFRVQPGRPGIAADHPDWCLRGADGAPLLEGRHGTWVLDASNPAAIDWLRDLGARVRDWGFEMVKVDFCYLAALEAARFDARRSGVETLRLGMEALVDGLGNDIYVLGCGMPMLPAVGLCHGNRVGHDLAMPRAHQALGHPIDDGWTGFAGVRAQARNVAARWALAGRWYDADPEVVMAWGNDRGDPAGYSTDEARTMATMAMMCGGPFLLADDLGALNLVERSVIEEPALLDLLRCSRFRPIDAFQHRDDAMLLEHAFVQGVGIPRIWTAEHEGTRVVALFNWDDHPIVLPVPVGFVGVTELWSHAVVGRDVALPPHSVCVLRA